MKCLSIALLFALSSTPALAAREFVSLDCASRPRAETEITLQAKSMWTASDRSEGTLSQVTVTVGQGGGEKETGRARSVPSDANYHPRKYKNTLRFDLSRLVDVKDFGRFLPMDTCVISAMIPNDVVTSGASHVEVPVVINCDQGGGSQTLDCSVSGVR